MALPLVRLAQLEVEDMCRSDGMAAKLAKLEADVEDAEKRKAGEVRYVEPPLCPHECG